MLPFLTQRGVVAFGATLVGLALACGAAPSVAADLRASVVASHQPLDNVLISLGKTYAVNVVLLQSYDVAVDVALHDVTLDEALDAILRTRGIRYTRSGKLVVVGAPADSRPPATLAPRVDSDVATLANVSARAALGVLRGALPKLQATVGPSPNLVLLRGSAADIAAARRLLGAIDVPDPTKSVSTAFVLQRASAGAIASELKHLYPEARFFAGADHTVLASGPPTTIDQARTLVAALDVSSAPPKSVAPAPAARAVAAVPVVRARASDVARTVAREMPGVSAAVSGAGFVVLSGSSADVARAKTIVAQIDRPSLSDRYVQIYRLHNVDARSVGDLITRTFRDVTVTPDVDLNSLAISATASEHERIADAIAQLDGRGAASGGVQAAPPPVSQAGSDVSTATAEVITLKAAVPGLNGTAPTSATDIATAVGQALQQSAPDLHITVPANATQLILTGSPNSIRQGKELIEKLDTLQKLVVLDTEIYEVDESAAKQLGLRFINPILSTTYTETTPAAIGSSGVAPPLLGLQQLTRTPLALGAQLDFAVSTGNARIVADPRLTTISGRTASLRAGENLAIQTQVGGGQGTVATTQIQTFQTGVTLDITPVINEGDYISVTLHPTVNSNTGFVAGIPQISTRDTQTTVAMHEGQTLFIGGLIEDTTTRNETKIPLLGDLPVIGKIFRDTQLNYVRNELVITVTPHIIDPLDPKPLPPPPTIGGERQPIAFPTIPPNVALPTARPNAGPLASTAPVAPGPVERSATPAPNGNVSLPGSATPQGTGAPSASATPGPTTFVFGQRPSTPSLATPQDPPQIVFVSLAPTSFRVGAALRIEAATSTNVTRMTIGYNGFLAPIAAATAGSWVSNFNFVNSGLAALPQQITLTLTAYRQDGTQATMAIPVTVTP